MVEDHALAWSVVELAEDEGFESLLAPEVLIILHALEDFLLLTACGAVSG